MSVRLLVLLATFVAISSGLPAVYNTSAISKTVETSENVVFWTSGKKVGSNNWRWESTGRPVHYTNWAKGEPNNSGGQENCIEVRFNSTAKTLEWNDDKCDSTNYFICESRDP
nr:unnamed protein product [Callosobruchus chinensis]